MTYKMTVTFEANGKVWMTDEETHKLMCQYRTEGNQQMLAYVFQIGQGFGRIIEAK